MENYFNEEPSRTLLVSIITRYEHLFVDNDTFISYEFIGSQLKCILYNFGDFVRFISKEQIDEYLLNV